MTLLRTAPVHFDGKESDPYLDDGGAHYPPINAGAVFSFSIELTNDDDDSIYGLTGASAQWVGRTNKQSATELFDVAAAVAGPTGTITIALTAVQTAAIAGLKGKHQLELTLANGDIHRVMEGDWECSDQVTA